MEYFEIGNTVKLFGFDGSIILELDVDNPTKYAELKELYFQINNVFIKHELDSCSLNKNHTLKIHLKGIATEAEAKQFLKHKIYLPVSSLEPLSGKRFYFHEVIGFEVMDSKLGLVGKITSYTELPAQVILNISYKDKEILFPAVSEFINSIDRVKKQLHITAPEGLIESYLND